MKKTEISVKITKENRLQILALLDDFNENVSHIARNGMERGLSEEWEYMHYNGGQWGRVSDNFLAKEITLVELKAILAKDNLKVGDVVVFETTGGSKHIFEIDGISSSYLVYKERYSFDNGFKKSGGSWDFKGFVRYATKEDLNLLEIGRREEMYRAGVAANIHHHQCPYVALLGMDFGNDTDTSVVFCTGMPQSMQSIIDFDYIKNSMDAIPIKKTTDRISEQTGVDSVNVFREAVSKGLYYLGATGTPQPTPVKIKLKNNKWYKHKKGAIAYKTGDKIGFGFNASGSWSGEHDNYSFEDHPLDWSYVKFSRVSELYKEEYERRYKNVNKIKGGFKGNDDKDFTLAKGGETRLQGTEFRLLGGYSEDKCAAILSIDGKWAEPLLNTEKPPTPQLPNGQWYKHISGSIVFKTGEDTGLGASNENNWYSKSNWSFDKTNPEQWNKATDEEVFEMLKKQCIKRYGINWVDVKIEAHANNTDWGFLPINKSIFEDGFEVNYVFNSNGCLYNEGKWATPLPEPKPELTPGDYKDNTWYKSEATGFLFYLEKSKIRHYGFFPEWSERISWFNKFKTNGFNKHDHWVKATNEEIESRLKEEAVERGLIKGVRFISPNGTDYGYEVTTDKYKLWESGIFGFEKNPSSLVHLMSKGQWATIIPEPTYKYGDIIVATCRGSKYIISYRGVNGQHIEAGHFQVIDDKSIYRGGYFESIERYATDEEKECFMALIKAREASESLSNPIGKWHKLWDGDKKLFVIDKLISVDNKATACKYRGAKMWYSHCELLPQSAQDYLNLI